MILEGGKADSIREGVVKFLPFKLSAEDMKRFTAFCEVFLWLVGIDRAAANISVLQSFV